MQPSSPTLPRGRRCALSIMGRETSGTAASSTRATCSMYFSRSLRQNGHTQWCSVAGTPVPPTQEGFCPTHSAWVASDGPCCNETTPVRGPIGFESGRNLQADQTEPEATHQAIAKTISAARCSVSLMSRPCTSQRPAAIDDATCGTEV